MDAVTLAVVAMTYTGSLVAKKFADDAVTLSWTKLKKRLGKYVGVGSDPAEVGLDTFRGSGVSEDEELAEMAERVVDGSAALRRARLVETAVAGARILWVDDNPRWNLNERRMLEGLGAVVVAVDSTPIALALLQTDRFDLVLSDMARGENPAEGLVMLKRLGTAGLGVPTVFYVGAVDPERGRPPGSAGIADHPEELLHLVLDALERSRL